MNELKENQEFEFLKEKIKEKPINRRRLLKRTLITVSMAVVFGLVACLTFLVLEPVINNWLYPEEETEIIRFPEEEEEINPEDMLLEDPTMIPMEEIPIQPDQAKIEKVGLEIEDYAKLYEKLYALAAEVGKSVVTVTGLTSDVDWFNNPYENSGQTSGVIVADNGKELLILSDKEAVENAENIRVTFCNGSSVQAILKKTNENVGLAALAIPWEAIDEETKTKITIAKLGSSNVSGILTTPIIAIGSPLGNANSIAYGMVTSNGNTIGTVDSNYKLMTTDIYGSAMASGVVVNIKGQVIGIIHQEHNSKDMKNIVSALGITELKSMIEKLSNGQESAYVGIYGTDVPKEANAESGIPIGAYVKKIEMDSPAMQVGIQAGDIIVSMNEIMINSYSEYTTFVNKTQPNESIRMVVMRQSKDGYQEMKLIIAAGTAE